MCRFKLLESANDFSVVFRHDNRTYYDVCCHTDSQRIRLYHFDAKKRNGGHLREGAAEIGFDKLHTLSIGVLDDNIACCLDGRVAFWHEPIGNAIGSVGFRGSETTVDIASFEVFEV